jgi:hypothetical protein
MVNPRLAANVPINHLSNFLGPSGLATIAVALFIRQQRPNSVLQVEALFSFNVALSKFLGRARFQESTDHDVRRRRRSHDESGMMRIVEKE